MSTTYADHLRRDVTSRIAARLETVDAALPDTAWLPGSGPAAGGPAERAGPLAALEPRQARALVAASLIESDIRFGAIFAALQDPLRSRRPCIGLLSWLLAGPDDSAEDVARACHELVHRGLLIVDNPADPRAEWVVRVPVPVWDAVLLGSCDPASLPAQLRLRTAFPPLAEVAVGPELTGLLARLPDLLVTGGLSAVVVRGPRGSGRTTLLGSAAAQIGLGLLVYEGDPADRAWQVFAALASLLEVLPVARCDPGPGATLTLPELLGVCRPLGVVAGMSGGFAGSPLDHAITVTMTPCGAQERRLLWGSCGLTDADAELDEIADRFLLTPGTIVRAAPLARIQASAARHERVTVDDVTAATRTLRRQELETLATALDPLPASDYPILGPAALDELQTLVRRCRHRERLARGMAAGFLPNLGVRALFSGPSGTGKTLAARHLASLLGLDLYRVDLAAVVNKYIGETERNLDRVLSRAEELDVVVLLDEGDALMTRRTEVANANDRYANLETNFLLQRLETFRGIVIVTSNAAGRIDPAFLRRIDVTVDFTPPDAEQRWQIWSAHLPADHEVEPVLLTELAQRCALTGGQIRNAALHAMLLAVDAGCPVSSEHVLESVRREYRRSGAAYPLAGRDASPSVPAW
jgi:hypothetical protein